MRVIYRSIIAGGVCGLSLWGLLVQGGAHHPSAQEERQAWAKEVFEEYCPELRENPDVFACIPDGDDIRIVTDRPTAVPAKLD